MDIKIASGAIEIRVQGAKIRIADIYQASTERILRMMRELWLAGDIRKR